MERQALAWAPRIAGALISLFLALFALDVFEEGVALREVVPDLLVHLAPSVLVLAVVGVSWRRPWIGGLIFMGLAAAYAYVARDHLSWVATVSGPLAIAGVLFLWSWIAAPRRTP
jgi:hypothetical protein